MARLVLAPADSSFAETLAWEEPGKVDWGCALAAVICTPFVVMRWREVG